MQFLSQWILTREQPPRGARHLFHWLQRQARIYIPKCVSAYELRGFLVAAKYPIDEKEFGWLWRAYCRDNGLHPLFGARIKLAA